MSESAPPNPPSGDANTENPPSPTSKHPPKLAPGANKADKTRRGYDLGVKYINKWMEENQLPIFLRERHTPVIEKSSTHELDIAFFA